jgi:hypothetical protein
MRRGDDDLEMEPEQEFVASGSPWVSGGVWPAAACWFLTHSGGAWPMSASGILVFPDVI